MYKKEDNEMTLKVAQSLGGVGVKSLLIPSVSRAEKGQYPRFGVLKQN
jgi:hypothetical protein